MSDCENCARLHDELEESWTMIAEFQRRLLIIANAVRGTERATLRLCLRCDMTARLIHAALGGKAVVTTQ